MKVTAKFDVITFGAEDNLYFLVKHFRDNSKDIKYTHLYLYAQRSSDKVSREIFKRHYDSAIMPSCHAYGYS